MDNLSVQIIFVAIIVAALGAIIMRSRMRKNKREELYKLTDEKLQSLSKLSEESSDALERAEQISKSDESITLFNKWFKEFGDIEIELGYVNTDFLELTKIKERGHHKDYLELDAALNNRLSALEERLRSLHKRLFNFTSYELENTKIAIDLKQQLKDLQNKFELNLGVKEIYTESFEKQCGKIDHELIRFEDLQKRGEYPKARKHLKNATDFINNVEFNYDVITNMLNYIASLEANIDIIDQVSGQIEEKNFRLDEDEYFQNYDNLKLEKDAIAESVEELTFNERITDSYINRNERQLTVIQDSITHIKESIEEQYAQIKVIEDFLAENEDLIEQSDTLVQGALEERDEINSLYQMPENRAIQRLEAEIGRYENFCSDYEILQSVVFDLKENYPTLVQRVGQSNEYLKHFISNMKGAIEGLREIRIDEINALENIEGYKTKVTQIELYISSQNHYYTMSHVLADLLRATYDEIEALDAELVKQPLNISLVRQLNNRAKQRLIELERNAQVEISDKAQAEVLLRFIDRFIDSSDFKDEIQNCLTKYNNKSYHQIKAEIRRIINREFENSDMLYKQVTDTAKYKSFGDFAEEM